MNFWNGEAKHDINLSIKSYPIRLIFNGEKYSFHHFGWWKYRWNHQDHAFYKLASRPRQKPAENSTLSAAQVRHLMDFLLKYGSFLDIFRLNLSESKHGWETHESVSQVSATGLWIVIFFLGDSKRIYWDITVTWFPTGHWKNKGKKSVKHHWSIETSHVWFTRGSISSKMAGKYGWKYGSFLIFKSRNMLILSLFLKKIGRTELFFLENPLIFCRVTLW